MDSFIKQITLFKQKEEITDDEAMKEFVLILQGEARKLESAPGTTHYSD